MIKPDSGEWQLFGKTPKQASWNDVGYLFETTNAYTILIRNTHGCLTKLFSPYAPFPDDILRAFR